MTEQDKEPRVTLDEHAALGSALKDMDAMLRVIAGKYDGRYAGEPF